MKRFILSSSIIILIIQSECLSRFTLQDCWNLAEENYPIFKNKNIEQKITDERIKNYNAKYLPEISLFGQVQYLSDVTKVEIPFPNINLPTIKNDQYKTGVSLNQLIWDGGIMANQKSVEILNSEIKKKQIDVEIYKIKQKVNDAYFNIIVLQKREESLIAADSDLTSKHKIISKRVEAGLLLKSNADIIEAELLKIRQNTDEIKATKLALLQSLSELIGRIISEDTLVRNIEEPNIEMQNFNNRPEYGLFNANKNSLKESKGLIDARYNPKINIFSQAAYGRPGLNMLDPDFEFYYIIGLQATWNFWSWGTKTREKEILEQQEELVKNQEAAFTQSLNLASLHYLNDIEKLKEQLKKDDEIISLRRNITKQSYSQFQNGIITANEYLSNYWSEVKAVLEKENRQIQLLYEQYSYLNLMGQ